MPKTMLINVSHAEESRVGIVEDDQLESFEIEAPSREHLKGNIYKGIVRRIHPAIEAAFVDIGAGRDAFLPLDEICFRNLPRGRGSGDGEKGRRRIREVLKSGDQVLVQIVKEAFTNKPPTVSTFYSLPGRYLVFLPGSEDAGISRKIEGEERVRIRELLAKLHPPPGCGVIVRTAAGFDDERGELQRDLDYLQRQWKSIQRHAEGKRAPALVYREHDLVLRSIRDYFTPDISEIVIDDEEVFQRAHDFFETAMPGQERLLRLYTEEQPIFSHFGLETQIESIYQRRVQLKSGGSIVIDPSEALTAIDVNSGGSMRGGSQEETAFKTNKEAAREIARQLRLRDLGGIIVIDFIDMRMAQHCGEVERTLREAMRPDKARHDIGRISKLGLLEISRQRLRPTAASGAYGPCPVCEGSGSVRTTESAALVVLRKIHNRVAKGDVAQLTVTLPHEVALSLLNRSRADVVALESRYSTEIRVAVGPGMLAHESRIEARTREVLAPVPAPRGRPAAAAAARAGVVVPIDQATRRRTGRRTAGLVEDEARGGSAAAGEGEEERPRRRRRRGGRGRSRGAPAATDDAHGTPPLPLAPGPAGDAGPSAGDAGRAEASEPASDTDQVVESGSADTAPGARADGDDFDPTGVPADATGASDRADHWTEEDRPPAVSDQPDAAVTYDEDAWPAGPSTAPGDGEPAAHARLEADAASDDRAERDDVAAAPRDEWDDTGPRDVPERPARDAPAPDRAAPATSDERSASPIELTELAIGDPGANGIDADDPAAHGATEPSTADAEPPDTEPDGASPTAGSAQAPGGDPRRRRRRGGRRGGRGRRRASTGDGAATDPGAETTPAEPASEGSGQQADDAPPRRPRRRGGSGGRGRAHASDAATEPEAERASESAKPPADS